MLYLCEFYHFGMLARKWLLCTTLTINVFNHWFYFIYLRFIFYAINDIILNLINSIFFQVYREFSHFYQLGVHFELNAKHWHYAFDVFKKMDSKNKKRCDEKSVEIWYFSHDEIFGFTIFSLLWVLCMFIFTSHLHVPIICRIFCFIVQQERAETCNIAINYYNENHPFQRTLERILENLSKVVNKRIQCSILILQNN